MGNCAIVGINWGAEGKGRMVDLLTPDYDIVVRYQGGGNAGHTVVNEKGKFALHLLPSGIFRDGVVNILGNGVALDCENLLKEIDTVRQGGVDITPENQLVSERASLLLPRHRELDALEEQRLKAGLQAGKDAYGDQIQELLGKEVIVPETPFPVVKLADLYKGLEEEFGYTVDESEKGDLTTEAERLSYEWVKKHNNHEFLFITDYSDEKRAFYHMRDENGVPQGYDLIWRGVEITTGAQREHRYVVLKKQAEEKGLAEDVKFYLEFFQYGCPPHGGFGLGIDRLTMLLCGLTIKDAEFLFRGPNRLTP